MIEAITYHFDRNSAACSTETGASDPRNSCDTPETVRQIMAFNEGFKGMCAVKPKQH